MGPRPSLERIMHAPDCPVCSPLTRDNAFWCLSQPHIIPVSHGSSALARDLYETLRHFRPGDAATFDYDGRISPAPRVTITMGADGTLTAVFTRIDGTEVLLTGPAVVDESYPPMITSVLKELARESKNPGVRIVGGSGV
jgi:hypothetical protein